MLAALILIPLASHVAVAGASVRLQDLLAPGAAAVSAAEARTVVIEVAPAPGSPLGLNREEARSRLEAAGLDADEFTIPVRIEITRVAHPLPLRYVQAALAAHLHRAIAPDGIRFTAPLITAEGDPDVVVESERADLIRGELELRCRARRDPALLPFMVAMRLPRTELLALRPVPAAVTPARAAAAVLVHPGQVAALEVKQKEFQLVTQVMPLEAGRAGERIRALSLATHATLEVEVTGPNQVRAITVVAEAPHAQNQRH
ncbi:MAG: hypothetical protein ACRD1E_10135 [Terriglobales bacterium]